ncbi:non-ribosomal peptide synthetase [Amycolatopsis antarctica]|nr:non-ribosomal peptide synthetase [Amycolatopsis antarctica]
MPADDRIDGAAADPGAADLAAAELLERRLAGRAARPREVIARVDRSGPLPLSHNQRRLWFLHEFEPEGVEYHSAIGMRLVGELDPAALALALSGLVARHETLRTTFSSDEGSPVLVLGDPEPVAIPFADVSAVAEGERSAAVDSLLREEMRRPFDLTVAPLIRALLVREGEREHVLLLSLHHIVADGWSKGVLARDLGALYRAAVTGEPDGLPELPVQYPDFAAWQAERLAGGTLDEQLGYWTTRLDGVAPLELPTDRPRPAVRTTAGALHRFDLPAALAAELTALARRRDCSLFTVLTAAVQVLLSRYCRQSDVAVGTVTTGRDRTELEQLVGFFVNTVVLRSQVDPVRPFDEFLAEVTETVWEAFARQDTPFDTLTSAVRTERDPSRTPLVQAMVVLQNVPGGEFALPGLRVTEFRPPCVSSAFDVIFEFTERESGALEVALEYNTDLFDKSTMDGLERHLGSLLTGIVAAPGTAVGALPLLTEAERETVTTDWAVNPAPYAAESTVHELVAGRARATPDAVAVRGERGTLTYGELDTRANRLAQHLVEAGVTGESLVGVCLPRGPELIVALLAVLKAGGAYVPLDPDYPADRLAFMLTDTGARLVLTESALAGALPAEPARLLCVDTESAAIAARPDTIPPVVTGPGDLAYVIYTSGSTGTPKGAMIEHRAIVRLVDGADFVALTDRDVVAQAADATFDAATFEIWGPLTAGAAMVVLGRDTLLDPAALIAALRRHEVSTLWLTVAVFNQVVAEDPAAFNGLANVIFGGEAANAERVAQVLAAGGPARLVNGYGPTETTTFAAWELVESVSGGIVPIGGPIANSETYVLDEAMRPAPVGVPGELFIGGPGVARGYLGRPELTAERFLDNPFATGEHRRLYRTGDVVRWNTAGRIEFLGRADHQVKVRGYRIEPGEVEAVLARHPEVAEVVVTARGEGGATRLVGYVQPVPGAAPTVPALREFTGRALPDYMVPTAFVVLDRFPLTASGKLDRRALPEPEVGTDPGGVFVAPRTETERVLAEVWAQVLGAEVIGVRDNFFDLGGDSILSIQVVSKARRAGIAVTSKDVFTHQTVAELALAATTTGARHGDSGPVSGAVPLTPVQHWFFANHDVRPQHFNQSMLVTLAGDADAAALGTALRALVEHHDALRMRFRREGGRWRQDNLATDDGIALSTEDLSAVPEGERETRMLALADAAQASLDLEHGPLLRVVLFAGGTGTPPRLLLVAHHLVVDGVSWRILLDDLDTAYAQAAGGEPVRLGERTTSFRDWARGLREHAAAGGFADEAAHWNALAGMESAGFPAEHDTGANTVESVREIRVRLGAERTRVLLNRVPAVYRTRVDDLLLAALAEALGAHTGARRVLIDLEGHGREEIGAGRGPAPDLSRTVGWFTTIFPVLLDVPGPGDAAGAIKSAKETLRSLPRKGIGYGALRWLHEGAEPVVPPVDPEISVNYLGRFDTSVSGTGLCREQRQDFGRDHDPAQVRPHALDILASVQRGELEIGLHYSHHRNTESGVRDLATGLLAALERLIDHCLEPGAGGVSPSDFPLAGLDQAELDSLAGDGSEVEDVYPLTATQRGMLFHVLAEPESGVYFDHVSFLLDGVADVRALGAAWRDAVAATPILRTSVHWENLSRPVQVVHRPGDRAELEVRYLDLRAATPEEQREAVDRLIADDRARGIDLTAAPLTRLAFVRVAERTVRVVWAFHHLILDGWSSSELLGEIFDGYGARIRGETPGTARRRPFRDHLAWLAERDRTAADEHWRRILGGLGEPTPLPFDRAPEPGYQPESREQARVRLEPEATAALLTTARRLRLTVNALVQGAWALLLSRHSGRREVCFGATVAGRPADLPGVDSIIGNFINTLPVRVAVHPDRTVADWLSELQAAQVEARQFEYVPLAELRAFSAVPAGTPLFDSIVVFENYPGNGEAAARNGLALRDLRAVDTTSFALDLTAYTDAGTLELMLSFDPALFDRDRIERMAGHLRVLLAGMCTGTERPVRELPMLAEAELLAVTGESNGPAVEVPAGETVLDLFDGRVAADPDAVAVRFGEDELTYRELDERANQLAHRLIRLGVRPGTVAAVGVERGPAMPIAVLGVLRAGGAYLPLDPNYPADRLEFMLADTGASVLVTEAAQAARLPVAGSVVLLDGQAAELAAEPKSRPVSAACPDDLAYVIFTSGSTGRPKGVTVTHRNLRQAAASWAHDYQLDGRRPQRIALASLSFDVFVADLVHSVCFGGTMVICPAEVVTDPPRLLELIERTEPADLETVPSLVNAVLQEVAGRDGTFPPLHTLVVGSDAWRTEDARALLRRLAPGTRLLNSYGVTEATVESSVLTVSEERLEGSTVVPIGRPLAGVDMYVLDGNRDPVPIGVTGELYIGGRGVARGYLNRPELTGERFVPDPFSADPGARLYRTGDRARYRADGALDFLGRADHQVKVRGFRIEPGEVEAVLARHPAVAEVVVAVPEQAGPPRLVAYVVPAGPASEVDTASLRELAGSELPDHMVPSVVLTLTSIPLSVNGKVDRRALPAPAPAAESTTDGREPRTATERILARVWAEVLRVPVGVEDNFFDLGGDSIMSIQVVSRARQEGLAVTSRDVFAHQNVEALAEAIDRAEPRSAAPGVDGPVTGRTPLTPIQRAFFACQTAEPGHHNMSVLIGLNEVLDPAVLRTALDALLTRHDALRMRYTTQYGRWRQENAAPGERWPLECVPLPSGPGAEAELERLCGRAQAALDLAAGPLVRAVLFEADGGGTLLLTAHHLVVDAVSWRILLADLETAYGQALAGSTVDLGAKTTSFRDWALRLSEHTGAGGFDDEMDHWFGAGQQVDATLPVDREGERTAGTARTVRVALDEADTRALLHQVPAAYRTRINDVLLSALAWVLAQWTGRDRVLLELEGHGREELFDDVDLSATVGWFTSAFPVAFDVPAAGDWGGLVKAVKEQLHAMPRNGIGFGALRWLSQAGSPGEVLAESPRPLVSFNYLGRVDGPDGGSGRFGEVEFGAGREQADASAMEYLLDIVGMTTGGKLELSLYYSTACYEEATVQRLGDALVEALHRIITHCVDAGSGGVSPSDFPLAGIDQSTMDRLVGDGANVADLYPLTPMQRGLLFHVLTEEGEGVYLGQLAFLLDGIGNARSLGAAWQRVVDSTPVLRTAVLHEDLEVPLQVVHSEVEVPIRYLDWREVPAAEQPERLAEFLRLDRNAGMDITEVPLMRLTLITLSGNQVRVVWTSHHLLLDGWSAADIVSEVLEHYLAIEGRKDLDLPARRPFRDYVEWLGQQDVADAERHWREVLTGFTTPTPLPVDHRGEDVVLSGSEAKVAFQLSADRSAALTAFARKRRLTVNTIVQGAWARLLAAYSGERDVCFGSTVSGRPADLPGVESIAGIFINNLPVRVRVEDDRPLLDWLRELQDAQVRSRQFEYVSLSEVRGWSEVPGHANLFDSYVVFENYPYDGDMGAEHGVRISELASLEPTNYALVLAAFAGDRLSFRLAYEPGLFTVTTIERIMDGLRAMLEAMADLDTGSAEPPVGSLPVLGTEQRDRLVSGWNDTAVEYRQDTTILDHFARQVARDPEAVALVAGGERMTFGELDARSSRLAHHLTGRGVQPEVLVAVCLRRGPGLIVGLLAVLKAGGVYVPLDPAYPADRLEFILTDSGASLVLTEDAVAGRLPATRAVTVNLDQEATGGYPATPPPNRASGSTAAYVVYTSGSTGRPKGVVVEHRSLVNLYESHRATVFGPVGTAVGDRRPRIAHLAPASFDAAWNPVLWMVDGGELHLVDDDTRRDAVLLTEHLAEQDIDFLQTTPTLFGQLADCGLLDRDGYRPRGVALGGEAIGTDLWRRLRDGAAGLAYNFYGPTEATVDALVLPIADAERPTMGLPIRNMRAYVLDEAGGLAPVGAPGELYLAGAGLARGYLNRPELTAERFAAAPFDEAVRLYRTGDLVRRAADGRIEFLGRTDHQVKVRGHRIELGEIEAVLAEHPEVGSAAVLARGEDPARRELVGYVASASTSLADGTALTEHLRGLLPEYMVPTRFVVLDALPLTPNGKVDRAALPEPEAATGQAGGFVAPRNETEQILAGIWAGALEAERIGAHDDFFELGGHSILAVKVLTRIRKAFGVRLSFRNLLDTPTVAGIAELVEDAIIAQLEAEAAAETAADAGAGE